MAWQKDPSNDRLISADELLMVPTKGEKYVFVGAHAIYGPDGRYVGTAVIQQGGRCAQFTRPIAGPDGESHTVPLGFPNMSTYYRFLETLDKLREEMIKDAEARSENDTGNGCEEDTAAASVPEDAESGAEEDNAGDRDSDD